MASDQRDIDIARFAKRLAVVQALDNRQQARMLLNVAGDGVEMARALMRAERLTRMGRLRARH